ncbi:hypothetical protein SHIRM173S_07611 [Streptomyces hirsutus]
MSFHFSKMTTWRVSLLPVASMTRSPGWSSLMAMGRASLRLASPTVVVPGADRPRAMEA